MTNEELYEAAVNAANALHADRSVSMEKALDNLENLRDEIQGLIDAVESDIEQNGPQSP